MSAADFALLQPDLDRVQLVAGQFLSVAGEPIRNVYFLEGGVATLATAHGTLKEIEVGLIGREGLCGVAAVLRATQTSAITRMRIDDPSALRIPADALVEACKRSDTLQALLLRYVQSMIVQTAHTAVVNATGSLSQRLARWLLMCLDRSIDDAVRVTHEFIAGMMASDRSGITVALHILEGTGAIRGARGSVTIRDRSILEDIAGDAYGLPEEEYGRLIGPFFRVRAGA